MTKPFSRPVGSQGEEPVLILTESDLRVNSYHRYILRKDSINILSSETELKYRIFRSYLPDASSHKSIVDIGSSCGAIGLKILFDGYSNVTLLDHDPEYSAVSSEAIKFIGKDTFSTVVTEKFSAYKGEHDFGIALAIVHWLYSSTEDIGSLDNMVRDIKRISKESLVIEWVSEADPAIISERHIHRNPARKKADYSFHEFQKALGHYYKYTKVLGAISNTRELWIASDERISRNMYRAILDSFWILKFRFSRSKIVRRLNIFRYMCIKASTQNVFSFAFGRRVCKVAWGTGALRFNNEVIAKENLPVFWSDAAWFYDLVVLRPSFSVGMSPRLRSHAGYGRSIALLNSLLDRAFTVTNYKPWDETLDARSLSLLFSLINAETRHFIENELRGLTLPVTGAHGDFIMENVMLSEAGKPYLIDWEFFRERGSLVTDMLRFHMMYTSTTVGCSHISPQSLSVTQLTPTIHNLLRGGKPSWQRQLSILGSVSNATVFLSETHARVLAGRLDKYLNRYVCGGST